MTVGEYLDKLEEIIDILSEFDESEEFDAIQHEDGTLTLFIGGNAKENYASNLN